MGVCGGLLIGLTSEHMCGIIRLLTILYKYNLLSIAIIFYNKY